jgi:hypothetical protein
MGGRTESKIGRPVARLAQVVEPGPRSGEGEAEPGWLNASQKNLSCLQARSSDVFVRRTCWSRHRVMQKVPDNRQLLAARLKRFCMRAPSVAVWPHLVACASPAKCRSNTSSSNPSSLKRPSCSTEGSTSNTDFEGQLFREQLLWLQLPFGNDISGPSCYFRLP